MTKDTAGSLPTDGEGSKTAKANPEVIEACRQKILDNGNPQSYVMRLYEEGLLSGNSLLGCFGFDPKQEMEQKKEEDSLKPKSFLPEPNSLQVKSTRIEQARRNVEVLGKILANIDDSKDKEINKVFKANLAILNETVDIK